MIGLLIPLIQVDKHLQQRNFNAPSWGKFTILLFGQLLGDLRKISKVVRKHSWENCITVLPSLPKLNSKFPTLPKSINTPRKFSTQKRLNSFLDLPKGLGRIILFISQIAARRILLDKNLVWEFAVFSNTSATFEPSAYFRPRFSLQFWIPYW